MRLRITLESQLCACKKKVLFSGSALLYQSSLQLINALLTNCKKHYSNKAGYGTSFTTFKFRESYYFILILIGSNSGSFGGNNTNKECICGLNIC